MKKKIFIALLVLLSAGVLTGCDKKTEENTETTKTNEDVQVCTNISGGGFKLLFNTNGGVDIEGIEVCIACSPSSYEDIPTPVKEGYTFAGWYYDEELTEKVEATSTLDIEPKAIKNETGCITGYEDIKIHAKWN